jgi:hypothetical protein
MPTKKFPYVQQVWTQAEKTYIINNANKLSDAQISVELTRITGRTITPNCVKKKRQKLKIKKIRGRKKGQIIQKTKYKI